MLAAALAWVGGLELGEHVVGEEGRRWRWSALLASLLVALALAALVDRLARRARRTPRADVQVGSAGAQGRAFGLCALAALAVLVASALWVRRACGRTLGPTGAELASARGGATHGGPNVLLILVDTLRADALSCYGAPPGRTPRIDALAERGTLFESVLAPSSWTLPSVATLFTGVGPAEHGVGEFSGVLPGERRTLAEAFAAAGYACDAFLGNPLVAPRGAYDRGFRTFDVYDYHLEAEALLQRAGWELLRLSGLVSFPRRLNPLLCLRAAAPFWETRPQRASQDEDMLESLWRYAPPAPLAPPGAPEASGARPSFVYFHAVAPHEPYFERPSTFGWERPAFLLSELERLRTLYVGEVAHTDRVVGELLDRYEAAGLLEDTLVVLTADHGEEFQEHGGWRHGYGLYGEVVHVPLIVAGPGVARGRRVSERVGLGEVGASLLDLAGIASEEPFPGISLAPLMREPAQPCTPPERLFGQLTSQILNDGKRFYSVVEGPWKIVREVPEDGPVRELVFDLEHDPHERAPLTDVPTELEGLHQSLLAYEELAIRSEQVGLDPEDLEQMSALGYGGNRR